jgi:hypothetical protein
LVGIAACLLPSPYQLDQSALVSDWIARSLVTLVDRSGCEQSMGCRARRFDQDQQDDRLALRDLAVEG